MNEKPDFGDREDFMIIGDMLRRASEFNLEVEVVATFGEARKNGDDVLTAAGFAIYEWDL